MADTADLKSSGQTLARAGSNPASGTTHLVAGCQAGPFLCRFHAKPSMKLFDTFRLSRAF